MNGEEDKKVGEDEGGEERSSRGFGAIDPEKLKELSKKGGKSSGGPRGRSKSKTKD
jgi:general stress protein YciG